MDFIIQDQKKLEANVLIILIYLKKVSKYMC